MTNNGEYSEWLMRQPTDDSWEGWRAEGVDKGWLGVATSQPTNGSVEPGPEDRGADGSGPWAVEVDALSEEEAPPKARRKTQGERLREAVDETQVDLFHDPEFRTFASFEQDGHRETWLIRSAGFRRYVAHRFYDLNGAPPRAADLADFLLTLEGQAQFKGGQREVFVRIAPTDEGIAIDVGDEDWTAIEVDARGWRHVIRPTVRFIRPRGMLPLPVPRSGGTVESLRTFVNVRDEGAWRLIMGFLIMMFRPAGPYPVLALHGEQGSAKSTTMRVIRRLVDPRDADDRSAPRNDHDLAIHAMHNRVIALDNLSGLPDWLSDALSRLATGSGFSTRQLYTDSDEVSFRAARPVMLNGIGDVIQRSDLLDRAVLVTCDNIPEPKRRLEDDFWSEFEAASPAILGAVLDAVSTAIRCERDVHMPSWPRMADFARWVTAAEPALGWEQGTFLRAYYANRGQAHELALDADPIATAVRDLLATHKEWEGRASALLDTLTAMVGEQVARRKDWPAAATTLSNRLERLAPNLRAIGISVERSRGGSSRVIRLSKGRE